MMKLVQRFSELVKGTINGFDRIVFKGCILPLMSATETMKFCRFKGILNKDYKSWMMEQTTKIVDAAEQYAQNKSGQSITHLSTWKTRKESLAHERQQATGSYRSLVMPGGGFIIPGPLLRENRIPLVAELPNTVQTPIFLL